MPSSANNIKTIFVSLTILAVYQIIIFAYGQAWLSNRVPQGDFAGSVAVVSEMKHFFTEGNFSNWSNLRFCGSPNTFFWSFGDWFVYLPFTFFAPIVKAMNIGSLVFFGLAGSAMYGLCYYLTRKRFISFWAGLAYMLSPIFMFHAIQTGHTNFPPYYAVQPITILALWRLMEQPTRQKLLLSAVALVAAIWIDTERAVSSLPFVFILVMAMAFLHQKPSSLKACSQWIRSCLLWLVALFLLTFLLSAFFILPLMIESKQFALFSPAVLEQSRQIFGMNNPLSLFDRDGWLVKQLSNYLPYRDGYDAGNYYLGLSTLGLVLTVVLARKAGDVRIRITWFCLFICICLIWVASGTTSIYENFSNQMHSLYHHMNYSKDHPYLLSGVFLASVFILGLLLWLRKKFGCPPWSLTTIAITTAFLLLVIYTPIFRLLAYLPTYSHMRNPGYFLSALTPLALILAGAMTIDYFTEDLTNIKTTIIILLITTITLIDYWPYRNSFNHQIPPVLMEDFQAASNAMKSNPLPGRYLSRESFSPLADMHTLTAERATAWYWLNFTCPKPTHHIFMDLIYPQLHRPETIDHALALAGLFHVRFITYNLLEGPLPPDNSSLKSFYSGKHYAVFENTKCRDYVQFYPINNKEIFSGILLNDLLSKTPLKQATQVETNLSHDHITIKTESDQTGLLVLSQSLYPGWSAEIDGQPMAIEAIQEVLPTIAVPPGQHMVVFGYQRPWYFYASSLMSLVTFIIMLLFSRLKKSKLSGRKPISTQKQP